MEILCIQLKVFFVLTVLLSKVGSDGSNCPTKGVETCVKPHIKYYTSLSQEAAVMRFINDDLWVPCDKFAKMANCLKRDFPTCSYSDVFLVESAGGLQVLDETVPESSLDGIVDMAINYLCVEEYTVFNKAKNCVFTRLGEIKEKILAGCLKEAENIPNGADQICKNTDSSVVGCALDSLASVCGKPVAGRVKTILQKMCNILQNLAFKRKTSQSSTWDSESSSSKAVDGNANPDYYSGKSCSHTQHDANVWWAVDLGCDTRIDEVTITNRADNNLGHRLHDFNIGVSMIDPNMNAPRPSNYRVCTTHKGRVANGATMSFTCQFTPPVGRYVIIQIPGTTPNYLHICEVVIHGQCLAHAESIAYKKKTFQSSTYDSIGDSSKAVDGDANPDYTIGKSCIHTGNDFNAWWGVDLGCTARIDRVVITNRGDNGLGNRLHDFYVGVSMNDPRVTAPTRVNYKVCAIYKGVAKDGETLAFTCSNILSPYGRFVFIQIPGSVNFLHICEVVVNGQCV